MILLMNGVIYMKRVLLIFIELVLMFSLIACKNKNEEHNELIIDNTNNNTPIKYDSFDEIQIINLNDYYYVGDIAKLELNTVVDVEWLVSNDDLAIIDNDNITFLNSGSIVLTAKTLNNTIMKIIKIFDVNNCSGMTPELLEREEKRHEEFLRRIEEREKEAQEHGFSNYDEYQQYLQYLKEKEEYENELMMSDFLGISYEDYFCLSNYKLSYEEMKKRWDSIGLDLWYGCEDEEKVKNNPCLKYGVQGKIYGLIYVDNEKFNLFWDKGKFLQQMFPNEVVTYKLLDNEYSVMYSYYYEEYMMNNLYGAELELEVYEKIMKALESYNEEK